MDQHSAFDQVNRATWQTREAIRAYDQQSGWLDRGEEAAIGSIAEEVRSKPILDIGVGGGRTIPLLTALSADYVGIDYTDSFVTLCRQKYPTIRVLLMDARDLAAFPDDSFGLVMFSCNGIDVVDYVDRLKILHEINRVLRPGGLLVFSTHNRDGPGHHEQFLRLKFTVNPLRLGWRIWKLTRTLPRAAWNHWRHRRLNREFDAYSVRNRAVHDFGVVVVLTTQREQRRQLETAGFQTEIVFDNMLGRSVAESADNRSTWWFHFVARKVARAPLQLIADIGRGQHSEDYAEVPEELDDPACRNQ